MYTYSQSNGNLGSFERNTGLGGEGIRLPGGFCPPWPFKCRPLTTEEYRERDIEDGHALTPEQEEAAARASGEYEAFQARQRESQDRRDQNAAAAAAADAGGRKKITVIAAIALALGGGAYYYFKVMPHA